MNDIDKKVETQNIKKAKANPSRSKKLPFVLIILFGSALLIGGYYFSIHKISHLESQVKKSAITANQLQRKNEQLQDILQDLQEGIQKSNFTKTKNWQPIVIEHLIRMADLTLKTTKDVKEALLFLVTAKQYAKEPALSAINHALSEDIANLQTVSTVDHSSLILKIGALSRNIDKLPIVTQQFTQSEKDKNDKIEKEKPSIKALWQRFLVSTQDALKNIVKIRHRDTQPLISPDQETILRFNIQAKLLQTKLAIMQRQNRIYQTCLEDVANLIKRYFSFNDREATNIIAYIEELKQVNLQPMLPSLTNSISAISNFIKTNDQKTPPPEQESEKPKATQQTQGARLL